MAALQGAPAYPGGPPTGGPPQGGQQQYVCLSGRFVQKAVS